MDECVRLEEALQAEESRKAEQEQSPRRLPVRRRSAWPFSLKDFGRTDEIRLPPVSPELAAFSPGPPEVSPRRRGTNPSSPRTPQRSDNRNDPSHSSPRSPKRQTETYVERLSGRTETRNREERKALYSRPSTSKHQDRRRETTPQSPTLPGAAFLTDLGPLRRSESPRHRSSSPIAQRTTTNTQENRDEERPAGPENVAPAGDRTASVVYEAGPLQIAEIVTILRDLKAAGPVREGSQTVPHKGIKFAAVFKSYVPVKLNTDPPQHRSLVVMEITTVFPTITDLSLYQVTTKLSRTADLTAPGPKIAERAQHPLNKEDPETGGEKVLDMASESGAEDEFILRQKNFKSREMVIHVALLLEHDQEETTKPFHAGLRFDVSGRMHEPREDIKLSFEPKDFGEHCEHLVPKDLNLHELLLRWVGSERSVSASL